MKKLLIILLLLFAINTQAQIDTANWSLTRNQTNGLYSLLTNRTTIGGVAAGGIIIPLILTVNEIDTSKFQLLPNQTNGKYSIATNKGVLYGIDTNDIRVSVSYDMGGVNLSNANTWTETQTFYNVLANGTRLYNLGGSSNYWLNSYTQNLYADTAKSDIVFSRDVKIDSTLNVSGTIISGTGWRFGVAEAYGMYLNGASVGYFGKDQNYSFIIGNAALSLGSGLGSKTGNFYANNINGNSLNLNTDSTGAKVDSVYIGRHTLLVNCSNADSNVVWLSDYNVTSGQRYMVKKIDANSINVIVKSKSGYTIDGAISKIWNTQNQTFTFVYRNKTWYIL